MRRLGARTGAAVCAVLALAVVAESSVDVQLVRLPDAPGWTAVNHELARRPSGLVLELPIRLSTEFQRPTVEAPREYLARIDDDPRVNGYSGFQPRDYDAGAWQLNGFPAPEALALADELEVRYVVIRTDAVGYMDAASRAALNRDGVGSWDDDLALARISQIPDDRLANVGHFGDAWLVELNPPA